MDACLFLSVIFSACSGQKTECLTNFVTLASTRINYFVRRAVFRTIYPRSDGPHSRIHETRGLCGLGRGQGYKRPTCVRARDLLPSLAGATARGRGSFDVESTHLWLNK